MWTQSMAQEEEGASQQAKQKTAAFTSTNTGAFTSTKVQILTRVVMHAKRRRARSAGKHALPVHHGHRDAGRRALK